MRMAPRAIILSVRMTRVLCVALTGAALSILRRRDAGLAEKPAGGRSTLGVASGASLGG
jgi:iron complex transport system permease protein